MFARFGVKMFKCSGRCWVLYNAVLVKDDFGLSLCYVYSSLIKHDLESLCDFLGLETPSHKLTAMSGCKTV